MIATPTETPHARNIIARPLEKNPSSRITVIVNPGSLPLPFEGHVILSII